MPIDFDFEGARKAGATNKDISDYFKSNYNIDFDIDGAKKSGANDADILDYLNTKYSEPIKKKAPTTRDLSNGYKSALSGINGTSTPPSGLKTSPLPLKSSTTTTPSVSTPNFAPPTQRLSAEEQQAQNIVHTDIAAQKAQEFKQGVKQKLYDDTRYWRLQDKKEAQARGYTKVEDMYKDRESYLIDNYLDDLDKQEASAKMKYLEAKQNGNEKGMAEYYQQYLTARGAQREKYNSTLNELNSQYAEIENQLKEGTIDANFGKTVLDRINQRKSNLELTQKGVIDPTKQMDEFINENKTQIASVAKPSQTPYEKLREYTNALYTEVLTRRKELGLDEQLGGLEEYAMDYKLRTQNDAGAELDDLYAKEQKLKQATKLLFLNRTSLEDESALGVMGKSFVNSISPAIQGKVATNQTIANNLNTIAQEADIAKNVYQEQQKFADEEAKEYVPYSAKWFAAPIGSSMAIAAEFVPASLLSEGVLGLTKLGRVINIAEQYGKIKGLNTTAKYLNAVNKYKTAKAADTIGKFVIKTQANGIKFAATSEAVAQLFPNQADEVNATTGYFGGVIGKGVEQLAGGMAGTLVKVFGNKAPQAAKIIADLGEKMSVLKGAPKNIVGELGEEFGESLGQIYSESESWNEIKNKLEEQFGTLDKATQFVIQTGIMALGMGSGTSIGSGLFKASKDAYNSLPREERAKVDSVLDSLQQTETEIQDEVANEVKDELKSEAKTEEEKQQIESVINEKEATTEIQPTETEVGVLNEQTNQEVAPEVVSETVSEIEPPVVEQTTTDVGGEITPDVSQEIIKEQPEVIKERTEVVENKENVPTKGQKTEINERGVPQTLSSVEETTKALENNIDINDYDNLRRMFVVDNWDIKDVEIPEKIENDIFWQEKLVEKALKDVGIKFKKQGSKSSGSSYYLLETKDGEDFKLRVSDHAKKYDADGNIEYNDNTSPDDILEQLSGEIPDGKILKDVNLSESYHKAKADGSNPELVQAVESLLGKPSESARKGDNLAVSETTTTKTDVTPTETKEVVTEKVSEKPTKVERKAIAEAKVDEIADKVKSFADKYLAAKGIEGAKKAGFGDQNKVIDVIAGAVKTLVNAGIEIDEAIKQVRAFLDEEYDTTSIKDFEVKQAIARDELTDYAKEKGYSSYRNAVFAVKKYVREVGAEDVITKEDIDKAKDAKDKGEGVEKPTTKETKPTTKADKVAEEAFESEDKAVKAIIKAIKRSEGYDDATKEALAAKIGEYYDMQSHNELQKIAKGVIDALGGFDKAFAEMVTNPNIPANIKIAVLGEVLIEYKKNQDKAKTEAEKKEWIDKQADVYDVLDPYIREAGRGISYMQKIYAADPLAMTRRVVKAAEKRNALNKPLTNQKVADIKEIIEDEKDKNDAINEAMSEALGESKETIAALEKEIEKLRKEISKKQGAKGSSKNPIKLGISKDSYEKAKKRIFTKAYSNPFANPEFWQDMAIIAGYGIQEGFTKINEFYGYLSKELKGKYKDGYGEIYRRAKAEAIAQGANETDFTSDEDIETEIEEIEKLSDAEKLAKLSALKAKLQAQKEANAAKIAANRIISDANNSLNNSTTQKEKSAIEKLISTIVKKAKDKTTPKEKPTTNTTASVIEFAFAEQQRAKEIYDEAQKEVFEQIDNNNELTEDEKNELKQFLNSYKNSVFDILLTRGQKDKIIREKLIELGYAKQVNGKVVLDLLPLVSSEKSVEKAIDKVIDLVSKETGISKDELKDFKEAILIRAKELVADKKLSELNKYLKTKERYNAARLIGNKKRKTRVEKLLELYNVGGLRNKDVMRELSEDLGITTFTEQEEKWLDEQFAKINEAPTGAEREILEEELQAFLELKNGELFGNAFWDLMRSRMLSGPLTAVKNLSGAYDTMIMGIEKLLKTNKHLLNPLKWAQGVDLNIFKVLFNARKSAVNTAMDILVNGGVDLGTAFSETTMTKEGTPRVRYIEYDKKRIIPDLYMKIGKFRFNVNLYNSLRNREYVVGRFLAFVDTFNQIALGEMKAYSYLKNQYILNDPTLTEKQASQKAYDDLYSADIAKAKVDVAKEFEDRGIKLDLSTKADRYRFNRRVYESVAQKRSEEVTKVSSEFANRYTYKQHDMGVFPAMAMLITYAKKIFPAISSELKKYGQKNQSTKWVTDAIANSIETFTEGLLNTHMPFIQGVANILEKGVELTPYGFVKSGVYGIGSIISAAKKDKKSTEELASRSGEMLIRASLGMLLTSMLLGLADDDDDGLKKLYGSGDEDFRKQAAIKTVRPQNTIVISGRKVNLDYLGSIGVSLKAKAALMDLQRYSEKYKDLSDEDKYYAQSAAMAQTLMLGSYTQGIYDLMNRGSDAGYWFGKITELATRILIPFTAASRQAYGMANPNAKRPVNFKEQLAKYSGLVAGWAFDRPAFDFLGDTYEVGDLYSGSPDAFLKLLGTMESSQNNDLAKRVLSSVNYDIGFTNIKSKDERYYIFDAETGKQRAMTAEEEYDVNFETAKEFKKLVTELFYNIDNDEDMRAIYSDKKELKAKIKSLHTDAKYKAFEGLFNEVPMSLEKERELEELKSKENDNTN